MHRKIPVEFGTEKTLKKDLRDLFVKPHPTPYINSLYINNLFYIFIYRE